MAERRLSPSPAPGAAPPRGHGWGSPRAPSGAKRLPSPLSPALRQPCPAAWHRRAGPERSPRRRSAAAAARPGRAGTWQELPGRERECLPPLRSAVAFGWRKVWARPRSSSSRRRRRRGRGRRGERETERRLEPPKVPPHPCTAGYISSFMGKVWKQQMYPQYTTYYYPQYLQAKVGSGTPGGAAGLGLAPLRAAGQGRARAGAPRLGHGPGEAVRLHRGTETGKSRQPLPAARRRPGSPRRASTSSPRSRPCSLRPDSPLAFPLPLSVPPLPQGSRRVSSFPTTSSATPPQSGALRAALPLPSPSAAPGTRGEEPKLGRRGLPWPCLGRGGAALTSRGVAGRAYCCDGDGRNSSSIRALGKLSDSGGYSLSVELDLCELPPRSFQTGLKNALRVQLLMISVEHG